MPKSTIPHNLNSKHNKKLKTKPKAQNQTTNNNQSSKPKPPPQTKRIKQTHKHPSNSMHTNSSNQPTKQSKIQTNKSIQESK